jgi:tryptophanyl-tRNA synthetase
MTVTPWEVSGKIDYHKLIKEFGLQPLTDLPEEFQQDILFRRGHIFAARDFERIIECVRHKKPFVMMTGLMPTGKMHLGHMQVVRQMMLYQRLGAKCYIAVADVEAYHQRGQSLEESRRIALEEYIPNYIALGLKPENCEIYFQSDRSPDGKKACAYYRLQELLAAHATFSEFRAVYGDITPGKIIASTLQAADMLHAQLPEFEGHVPVVVPVGSDQDPHIRIARDMISRFKGQKLIPLSATYHKFLPGLGGGKMSSSVPTSYIAMTDTPKEVRSKIMKYAFSGGKDTVEEHRKHGGNPDIDVAFQYLTFFEPDDTKLADIKRRYKSGELLSGELKQILVDILVPFMEEHQRRREEAKGKIGLYVKQR